MKRITSFLAALCCVVGVAAQTLNVQIGEVTYQIPASQAGDMIYADGTTVTILNKTYTLSDVDQMYIDDTEVTDNTVSVVYSGSSAAVTVAGNVAQYLTISASGATVSIIQSEDLADEITYTLSGSSSDGSFYMDGELKASLVLNGLTLTSTTGAPLTIDNGKRISIELADGTTNSLVDCSDGEQKGCLACKGHIEFKGGGTLNVTGNTKHGLWVKEYVQLKASTGAINILGAINDGINCQQYFQQNGGVLTISGVGDDGIQVDIKDDDDDEDNTGEVLIKGGTLNITTTAAATKGIKSEGNFTVNEDKATSTITVTCTGGGTWDEDDQETKASACLKSDANMQIDAGTLTLKATGAGGKGIKVDSLFTVNGGTIGVTTTGSQYTYSSYSYAKANEPGGGGGRGGGGNPGGGGGPGGGSDVSSNLKSSPKGIKVTGNVVINDGNITVSTSGTNGEGIESKALLYINGGTINVKAYDDAINSSSHMYITGGTVTVYGTNNDGLDSNGDMYISGGTIIAFGGSAPECGIDANEEENYSVYFTGGNIFGIGGSASSHPSNSSSTQCYVTSSGSVSQNATVTLKSGSTELATFTMPYSYSNGQIICSAPGMTKGSKYTLTLGSSSKSVTAVQYSSNR